MLQLAAQILNEVRPLTYDPSSYLKSYRAALIGSRRMINVFQGPDGELSVMEDESTGTGCAHLAALDIESFCEVLAGKAAAAPPETVDAFFLHLAWLLDWIKRVVWEPAAARLLTTATPLTCHDWAQFSSEVHDAGWQTLKVSMIWPPPPANTVTPALKKRRLELVTRFRKDKGFTMAQLGFHVRIDPSAIYGMINGARTRYDDETLSGFLTKLNLSRSEWDRVSTTSPRHR